MNKNVYFELLQPFCTPVSLSSKGIQLWEILKTKNTDSVSVTTWIISAFTNFSKYCNLVYLYYISNHLIKRSIK